MRANFTKATQREAYARSGGVCECHMLAKAGIPGFQNEGCGRPLGIGNTFYEHVNPDAISKDNSIENCATLTKTCWRLKTATYDLPVIAKSDRVQDKARGISDPWRAALPFSRRDALKRKINGQIVSRVSKAGAL